MASPQQLINPGMPAADFLEGEIEAGFVFAAAAEEYWNSDRSRARACYSDALECYSTAVTSIGKAGLTDNKRQMLASLLNELRRRLDLLRENKLPPSAAA